MPRKLYIGNLPMNLSEAELESMLYETCGDFGEVEDLFIIKDKLSGEHRGFGFVTYANDAAADLALQLNGKTIFIDAPKPLRVVWARERSEQPLHAQTTLGYCQPAPWEQQDRLPWQQ
jgi:RNA recognition motif-containing protein